ncbi:hypothetical protein [Methanococcus maripaludis]|uniref:Uncharacterized protein n=1 Tax=Methanococcus maripaludis TaxID=39152 RepID=A0A8T4CNX7_METMI|nr:hypothetical protein [Methanococcus maripaludis]MBM7408783.1 hypothetical protein [Methanococcus maripaludis]MBP2219048.1 hypothetical protein [Methanococcus maripaludis]
MNNSTSNKTVIVNRPYECMVISSSRELLRKVSDLLEDQSAYEVNKKNNISTNIVHKFKKNPEYDPQLKTVFAILDSLGFEVILAPKVKT